MRLVGEFADFVLGLSVKKVKNKTKEQLIEELEALRQHVTEQEELEERYRALLELDAEIGEIIIMVQDTEQAEAVQTYVSDKWCQTTGYTREELLGMSFFDLVHPKYLKASEERHRRKIAGENIPGLFEMAIIRKDGIEVPIELTSAKTTYMGQPANVAYIRDITERKLMEQALRESEERYRTIFENTGTATAIVEEDTIFSLVNTEFEKISGYFKEEIEGKKSWTEFAVKDELDKLKGYHCMRRIDPDAAPKHYEAQIVDRKGQIKDVLIIVDMISGTKRNVVSLIDITERKKMEEELRQYHAHLEELVKKRTAELIKTNKLLNREINRCKKVQKDIQSHELKLESQIKQRTEFTRALVHEIKTPLTSVLVASDLLAAELKEEPWQSLARHIFGGACELDNRIDELLDLARGELGMLKLKLGAIDLQKLLHEVADWTELEAKRNKQSLIVDVPLSLPLVLADERRLRQILRNLLSNSLKFTPEGGKITLKVRTENAGLTFEVKDTGRGITRNEQKRLFQPYYRLESDREALNGLGLGLPLSRMFVELHKGRMWVKSQKGRGSIFGFWLPLQNLDAL